MIDKSSTLGNLQGQETWDSGDVYEFVVEYIDSQCSIRDLHNVFVRLGKSFYGLISGIIHLHFLPALVHSWDYLNEGRPLNSSTNISFRAEICSRVSEYGK